jgi:hypothetical protein
MQTKQDSLLHEDLVKLIDYCPDTGLVRWKVNNHRVSAGDILGSTTSATANGKAYARVKIAQKTYKLHRVIWFYMTKKWPTNFIDHIDGNALNNKWDNLREATRCENAQNKGGAVKARTGIKGLSYVGDTHWYAHVTANKKMYRKLFKQTPEGKEEAIAWITNTRLELHKEFAK